MDNLREMLFADTRFARYKDAEVGLCHLERNLYAAVEQRTVADNAEALFDILQVLLRKHSVNLSKW